MEYRWSLFNPKEYSLPINEEPNLYKLLQVDPEAEVAMIRLAHDFLLAKYEPSNENTGDPYKYKYVKAAWEILSNETSRERYDALLRRNQT